MPLTITPITVQDAESFHACLDAVARERRHIALLEAPPIYNIRAFVNENVSSGQPQFVARQGQRVIGWCDIIPDDMPSFAHTGTLGMGLLPEFRGQGLGRRLLEATLTRAYDIGIERVELQVFESNTAAIRLYEKIGFQTEGRLHKKLCIDGVYQDVIQMALFLDTPVK